MDSRGDSRTWRWLPWLLLAGLALRVAVALNTDATDHPDEIFQYLEPAHRLVFHHGLVAWEYRYGIRSWIIPGFVACILEALKAIGLARPDVYQPVIKIVFCVLSLSLPLAVYRSTRAMMSEAAARIALVLVLVWYEIVFFAHKPLADALCAYSLYGALALLAAGASNRTKTAFGVLCGLTLALRFQLAPAVGVMLLIGLWRWRWRGAWAAAGFAAMMAASGLLDLYTWGRPFSSILSNLELNLFAGVADGFGVRPAGYYLQVLMLSSLDLVFAGVAGLYLWRRTAWPLIAVGLVILASFSAIGHKEPRFILPLIPLWLMGVAGLAAHPALTGLTRRLAQAAPVLAAAVSLAGLLWVLPLEDRIYALPILGPDDLRQAYLALSRQGDVTGLIDQSGAPWWRTGGYFDLHQAAPIYRPDVPDTRMAQVMAAPERYASHWLLPAAALTPPGYRRMARFGAYALARRIHDPAQSLVPPGYSTLTATGLRLKPKVTPRW
jgi:hypothetical protein